MKAASFAYHRPDTVADAVGLLAELGDARVLAGGQSLVPMLNLRLAAPAHLIDINRVDGLSDVTRGPTARCIRCRRPFAPDTDYSAASARRAC